MLQYVTITTRDAILMALGMGIAADVLAVAALLIALFILMKGR